MKEYTDKGTACRCNPFIRITRGGPSGGSLSTTEDLLKFDIALRTHKLISPKFTVMALTPSRRSTLLSVGLDSLRPKGMWGGLRNIVETVWVSVANSECILILGSLFFPTITVLRWIPCIMLSIKWLHWYSMIEEYCQIFFINVRSEMNRACGLSFT